ncbi:GntR family transcriptional regulator [Kocuria marina]|uniref:GntR family transcriptional regulator n=1 Tax=Kocuria marina TaxID=223184 RepID=UPI003F298D75
MTSFHDRSSSSEDIARELTRDITSRATGTRLPSHRALVTRLGASASPVSRARALLAQRGLVISRPGAGLGREDVLVVGGGQAALSTAMRAVAGPWHDCRRRSRSAGGWRSARSSRPWEQTSSPITPAGVITCGCAFPGAPTRASSSRHPSRAAPRWPPAPTSTPTSPTPRVRLSYAAAPTTADLVTGIHRLEGLV